MEIGIVFLDSIDERTELSKDNLINCDLKLNKTKGNMQNLVSIFNIHKCLES